MCEPTCKTNQVEQLRFQCKPASFLPRINDQMNERVCQNPDNLAAV